VLGNGLVVLAHPWFALGAWEDSQPMSVVLLAAAALCLFGLGALAPRCPLACRSLLHPLTVAPLALALWSLLVLPLAETPWRTVLGPAENGQGILWFVAMAAFVAAALTIRLSGRVWSLILVVAAVSSGLAALLGLRRIEWVYSLLLERDLLPPVTLFGFNEYLAYSGLGLLVAAIAYGLDRRRTVALALGLVAITVLLVSRNRTAFAIIPLIFPTLFWLRGRVTPNPRPLLLLTAAIVAAGIGPVFVAMALGSSTAPDFLGSVWSRGVILRSLAPSLWDDVPHILAGRGWGAVPDELIRHVSGTGISLYQSNWGGLDRDIFHSHNAVVEALLSVGLPGAVMAALLPVIVLTNCDRRRLWLAAAFALCWATLDGFWFMMPSNVPFIGLAASCLVSRPRSLFRVNPSLLAGIAIVLGLVCSVAAWGLWVEAAQESRLARAVTSDAPAAPLPRSIDLRGDGHALASLLSAAMREGLDRGSELSPAQAERLFRLQQEAERVADERGSPILSLALINTVSAQALVTNASPLGWGDRDALAAAWEHDVRRLLTQAPERLDVLAPYLNWLVAQQREDRLVAMIAMARKIDGNHPVVLWFEGVALLQEPAPERVADGLERMRRALRLGLERIMPVDPAIRQALDQPALR